MKRRFLLFGGSGAYDLVDDFVQPDRRFIANVTGAGEKFVYSTQEGAKVVERTEERIREFSAEAPRARRKSNDEHDFGMVDSEVGGRIGSRTDSLVFSGLLAITRMTVLLG